MMSVLVSFLRTLRTAARSRAELQLEALALRHQLQVLQRTQPRRVRLAKTDRWLWVVLAHLWTGWRTALVIVKPETVIAWHRQGFRLWWTWKSRRREQSRTHLSLNKDAPILRRIAGPSEGHVVAIPQVGGLHHRYE